MSEQRDIHVKKQEERRREDLPKRRIDDIADQEVDTGSKMTNQEEIK